MTAWELASLPHGYVWHASHLWLERAVTLQAGRLDIRYQAMQVRSME